ncbi:MAG: aminotransferase class III-fold pyridoxal phosphate-dependent enzyme [Proteobacteria bacterium]|jgi:adenosylmethionine-8-amino-7-oxononanoate aminotransferase|nr:aminotransferase class III-fold pyridoxal phosphate-dependent enzyme [Pseudomonadota bacterium]MDA1237614.1 aminotransferase class III-fold pyridoxal phosphate-dependent enzyme [Pseudomonadota bacterium]
MTERKDSRSDTLKRGGPIQVFYTGDSKPLPSIERAEGIYMWDSDGKKYFDGSSGPVTTNLGHGNKRVIQAMIDQANKVCFASRVVFENSPNQRLAEKLVELCGPGFDQAFIVSGGSEATEAAIKLARQYAVAKGQPERKIVLARNPGYHGSTLGAVSVSGDPESDMVFGSMFRIMPKVPTPFSYRLPENHDVDSYARECARKFEEIILNEGSNNVLAFIIETVGGLSTGGLVAPDHYYESIREICSRYGVLLIHDDVMAGAGRTGKFLSCEHWPNARPDLVTLAKGVAAGYTPIGVVMASNEMVKTVVDSGGFLHGHTYSANPLSCAVAEAVVSEMIDNNLMDNASTMGLYLMEKLKEVAHKSTIIGDVRGKGLLMAAEIVENQETKKMLPVSCRAVYRLVEIGIENGLLLYTRKTAGGVFGEWLMISPALTVSKEEADELVRLFTKTIQIFEKELRLATLI